MSFYQMPLMVLIALHFHHSVQNEERICAQLSQIRIAPSCIGITHADSDVGCIILFPGTWCEPGHGSCCKNAEARIACSSAFLAECRLQAGKASSVSSCAGKRPRRDGGSHKAPHKGRCWRVPSGLPAGGLRSAHTLHRSPCRH